MKLRLARKIWKARDDSLFPNPKDYWANRWSDSQLYEGAKYDHRLAKASNIMVRITIKENEREDESSC